MPDSRWKLVSIRTLCGEGDGRRGKAERHQFQHFYPRPPRGGRPALDYALAGTIQFLSTPSARRATSGQRHCADHLQNFYPRPPRGGRQGRLQHPARPTVDFYPRPPRGGRLVLRPKPGKYVQFLSTPSTRRTTAIELRLSTNVTKFLSTPSARRATSGWRPRPPWRCNFYPRPPRGGRHGEKDQGRQREPISIHALREEGDFVSLSTVVSGLMISIHALREEGDRRSSNAQTSTTRISIHALREEGDITSRGLLGPTEISIHALREEGDVQCERPGKAGKKFLSTPSARRATLCPSGWRSCPGYFYPRPPRGGRHKYNAKCTQINLFLSTPSARRATCRAVRDHEHQRAISIHALREEGDRMSSTTASVLR